MKTPPKGPGAGGPARATSDRHRGATCAVRRRAERRGDARPRRRRVGLGVAGRRARRADRRLACARRHGSGRSSSYWSARSSRTSPASSRCGAAAARVVLALGAAIQLVLPAAPLLLSTDAWTYWGYGWIASDGGGNPYVDSPWTSRRAPRPTKVGADWRDTTTVYGPFTLSRSPWALLAGSSAGRRGLALQGVRGGRRARCRRGGRPRSGTAGARGGARRLEPGARDPPRGRWRSQRRARRRARRVGRRAGGAPPCYSSPRRVDARDRGEVGARSRSSPSPPSLPAARETHRAGGGRGDAVAVGAVATPCSTASTGCASAACGERGARDELRAAFAARAARAPPRRLHRPCGRSGCRRARVDRARRPARGAALRPRRVPRARDDALPRRLVPRGPCRSPPSTRTASHGSPRSRSRRTSRLRRSRSEPQHAYERLSRSTRMLSSSKTVSKRPLARSREGAAKPPRAMLSSR